MMRISTKSTQLQWLADVYRRQAEMARVQKQVSSGLRINTAADDPAGAGQVVILRRSLDEIANFNQNAEAVRRRLSLSESALDQFQGTMVRVRELAVQAGGGTQTAETRAAIAAEMRELMENLVDLANKQDGEGRYLFSGNEALGKPVIVNGGTATYNGDDGIRQQRVGDSRTVRENDPGSEVFFAIRDGNGTYAVEDAPGNTGSAYFSSATLSGSGWVPDTYTITFTAPTTYAVTSSGGATVASGSWSPGDSVSFAGASVAISGQPAAGDAFTVRPSRNDSVFAMVDRLASALEVNDYTPSGRADFQNALNRSLLDLDQSEGHLGNVRSSIGARLAAAEEQKSSNEELALQLEVTMSSVRDVDYPKAISDLETSLTALEAAQKVFAQTRASSLFDLL